MPASSAGGGLVGLRVGYAGDVTNMERALQGTCHAGDMPCKGRDTCHTGDVSCRRHAMQATCPARDVPWAGKVESRGEGRPAGAVRGTCVDPVLMLRMFLMLWWMLLCSHAAMQVCCYAGMLLCRYAAMQECCYAAMLLL
jgi:hypothetical protein